MLFYFILLFATLRIQRSPNLTLFKQLSFLPTLSNLSLFLSHTRIVLAFSLPYYLENEITKKKKKEKEKASPKQAKGKIKMAVYVTAHVVDT